MNKDSILKSVGEITEKITEADHVVTAIDSLKEMSIPEKFYVDVLAFILRTAMDQSGMNVT